MKPATKTVFAMKAFDLAEQFRISIAAAGFEGGSASAPRQFRIEISAPEGDSTGGGAQAVQHVTLRPEDGGAAIVIGYADEARRRGELRTFSYLSEQYTQRFHGEALPFSESAYRNLFDRLHSFFSGRGLAMQSVDAVERPVERVITGQLIAGPSRLPLLVAIVGALLVGLLLGRYFLRG